MGKIEMMMKTCSVIFEWDHVVIHQAQCNFTIHTYFLLDQIISKSSNFRKKKQIPHSLLSLVVIIDVIVIVTWSQFHLIPAKQLLLFNWWMNVDVSTYETLQKESSEPKLSIFVCFIWELCHKKIGIFSLQYTQLGQKFCLMTFWGTYWPKSANQPPPLMVGFH